MIEETSQGEDIEFVTAHGDRSAVIYQSFGTVPLDLADWALLAVVLAVCLPAYLAVATLVGRLGR